MTRVTSKLQVTVPKAIAERYGIAPGDEIEWLAAGEAIRVIPPNPPRRRPDRKRRLQLFDRATERQRRRDHARTGATGTDRGWRREDLYQRGSSD